jgi:hypothetical protein
MDSGYTRGQRDTRLKAHDGVILRLELAQIFSFVGAALGFAWLGLSTQRLGDGAKASAATAIALAQALKEEKDTARDTLATENTSSQSKWSKTNTIIAALSVAVTVLGSIYIATH